MTEVDLLLIALVLFVIFLFGAPIVIIIHFIKKFW